MDNLTHGLMGYALQAMRKTEEASKDTERGIFWAALIGSEAPDIDSLANFFGRLQALNFHRGFTHSPLGVLGLAALITLILGRIFPEARRSRIFAFTLMANLVHVFLDLLTSYGTKVLYPFSREMYTTDTLMIVDPVIILALVLGMVLVRKIKLDRVRVFRAVALFLALYIGSRAYIHHDLVQRAENRLGAPSLSVLPAPAGYLTWRYVAQKGDEIEIGEISYPSGNLRKITTLRLFPGDPVIKAAMTAPSARVFDGFARYIYAEVKEEEGNYVVHLYDPRYYYRNRFIFGATVVLDKELKVISDQINNH